MDLFNLACAAYHDLPDDVRKPALSHLKSALKSIDENEPLTVLAPALFATGDEEILEMVLNLPAQEKPTTPLSPADVVWPGGISRIAGDTWCHIFHTTLNDYLYQTLHRTQMGTNTLSGSIALSLLEDVHPTPNGREFKKVLGQRLTAEWNGAGKTGKLIDKLLLAEASEDDWVDALMRQPHYYGKAALLVLGGRDFATKIIVEANKQKAISGHDVLMEISHLPDPAPWRGMSNREAGQSLRAHLAQFSLSALSRKERKALERRKTRAGPHLAKTPEAIAKRKMRAAKKKRQTENSA